MISEARCTNCDQGKKARCHVQNMKFRAGLDEPEDKQVYVQEAMRIRSETTVFNSQWQVRAADRFVTRDGQRLRLWHVPKGQLVVDDMWSDGCCGCQGMNMEASCSNCRANKRHNCQRMEGERELLGDYIMRTRLSHVQKVE